MDKFILEGIDFLGKDTLAQNIQHKLGFHQVIHYTKPLVLKAYEVPFLIDARREHASQEQYQRESFRTMFKLLNSDIRLILNRAHLGECVYAPLYRGYSGDYIFELEKRANMGYNEDVRLILLVETFGTNAIRDDGLSLGPLENRIREQDMFIDAFVRSIIPNKRMIAVTNDVGYRDTQDILDEALA